MEQIEESKISQNIDCTIEDQKDKSDMLEQYRYLAHVDNDILRKSIPKAQYPSASFILKYVKSIVGSDLSRIIAPVNFNEPCSVLQKGAEAILTAHQPFADAVAQDDSLMRMVYVAAGVILSYNQTFGRTSKPFNPMLGETFEYITKEAKFFSETVCHHPPIFALNIEADSYEVNRICQTAQKFNGTQIVVTDHNDSEVVYKPTAGRDSEKFTFDNAAVLVGNIVGIGGMGKGGRYVEPQGDQKIINHSTGDVCYIKYRSSGWMKNSKDQSVEAVIKDNDGIEKYILKGKYTTGLTAKNIETGEIVHTFEIPKYPQETDPYYNYGFNLPAYQINLMSDKLKAKLPPTDSRLRPDLRFWENAQAIEAQGEMNRLVQNQKQRRNKVQELLKDEPNVDMYNERTFYVPQYFKKEVIETEGNEKEYKYTPIQGKYWAEREKGTWENAPRIFDDDCKEFYQ